MAEQSKRNKKLFKAIDPAGRFLQFEIEVSRNLDIRHDPKVAKERIIVGLKRFFSFFVAIGSFLNRHRFIILLFILTVGVVVLGIVFVPIIYEKIEAYRAETALTEKFEARMLEEKQKAEEKDKEETLEKLAQGLKDQDFKVRKKVIKNLGKKGKPAIKYLGQAALEDQNSDNQCLAVEFLGEIGEIGEAAVDYLGQIVLKTDRDRKCRKLAIKALGEIGGFLSLDYLGKAVLKDEDSDNRLEAIKGLAKIGKPALDYLNKASVSDFEPKNRTAALEAIGDLIEERSNGKWWWPWLLIVFGAVAVILCVAAGFVTDRSGFFELGWARVIFLIALGFGGAVCLIVWLGWDFSVETILTLGSLGAFCGAAVVSAYVLGEEL